MPNYVQPEDMVQLPPYWNDDRVARTLAVDGGPSSNWGVISRIVVPCRAGDVLYVEAESQFSNNIGPTMYTVGVGLRMLWYRYGDDASTRVQFGKSQGMNVDRKVIHHGPRLMERRWEVPADWVDGDRVVFQQIADAHSTQWEANGGGDALDVDNTNHIKVTRWTSL